MKTEERNDDPMENLVNDLKNAEEEVKTAAEEIRNDTKGPKPEDNVVKQRALLVRLSEDSEIDQSVKYLKVYITSVGILNVCNLWILLRKIVIYLVGRKCRLHGLFSC